MRFATILFRFRLAHNDISFQTDSNSRTPGHLQFPVATYKILSAAWSAMLGMLSRAHRPSGRVQHEKNVTG